MKQKETETETEGFVLAFVVKGVTVVI